MLRCFRAAGSTKSARAIALVVSGCGASSTATSPTTTPPLEVRGEVCPGWTRHQGDGRTIFALPGPASRETREAATAYVHAEGDVYFEIVEEVVAGMGGEGSDRAVIRGVLAGLGDPASAGLPSGWTVTSQGETMFEGRAAAERVIDIEGQVVRRERIVRAGETMTIVVTMVRRDREETSVEPIRCFERSIVFAAPPRS